jgi:hypothetical protein
MFIVFSFILACQINDKERNKNIAIRKKEKSKNTLTSIYGTEKHNNEKDERPKSVKA